MAAETRARSDENDPERTSGRSGWDHRLVVFTRRLVAK
jgi:hypothetical protein